MTEIELWYNPACSKSRQARELLEERGVTLTIFEYLTQRPGRERLQGLLQTLDLADARPLARSKEAKFAELKLAEADDDALLDALAAHPELIERPIAIRQTRGVIARPPERALELLEPEG